MSDDDYSGIVPLNECGDLHEAQHCVKTTGVTGGIILLFLVIRVYSWLSCILLASTTKNDSL
jgi:hypothetical protein